MQRMEYRELVALHDALIDAAEAAGKPAILIAQHDISRLECLYRWSCDDRSIGGRLSTLAVSQQDLAEMLRTWREDERAPGSTLETAKKAEQMYGCVVVRSNMPKGLVINAPGVDKTPKRVQETVVAGFDGGHGRDGVIARTTGECTVCKRGGLPVLRIDASEGEYASGYICLRCTVDALSPWPPLPEVLSPEAAQR